MKLSIKILFTFLLVNLICAATATPHEPCIDIDGTKSKIIIMPGRIKCSGRMDNPKWMGENKAYYLRLYHSGLNKNDKGKNIVFSFVPVTSGKVIIWLRSNKVFKSNKEIYKTWINYQNLSISGCIPAIKGFGQEYKSGGKGWHFAEKDTLVQNRKKNSVIVWHDSVAFRQLKVIAGQEVIIKVRAKFINK